MARCARLLIEQSGFEPWKRTLYCVLGQDSLLCDSQCLDLFPDVLPQIMRDFCFIA